MKIFQIAKTPVKVHWTLTALLAGLLIWQSPGGIAAMATTAAIALCVFGTVFLHELAHVLVARDFGYDTDSITLYPFGGIARIQMPVEVPPEKEIYIALAGPLVNAVLALGFFIIAYYAGPPYGMIALLNLAMFVFNMLPSYPMDGGRVMRSLLARRIGHDKATRISIRVSKCFAWLYFLTGVYLTSPILSIIGAYLLYLLHYRMREASGKQDDVVVS